MPAARSDPRPPRDRSRPDRARLAELALVTGLLTGLLTATTLPTGHDRLTGSADTARVLPVAMAVSLSSGDPRSAPARPAPHPGPHPAARPAFGPAARPASGPTTLPASGPAGRPGSPSARPGPATALSRAVAEAGTAGGPGVDMGVAVLDRSTGRLTAGPLAATPFYSASVVKLFVAAALLRRAETGRATVTPAHRVRIQRALTVSDDAAMSALWRDFDGPALVTELAGAAHLRETRPPARPGQWGETQLSARDVVAVYAWLLTTLTPTDRRFVMSALTSAQARGADGFDQSFGLLRVPRLPGVAAKQGWMIDGRFQYLHTTGTLAPGDRWVVAVLSKRPAAAGWDTGRAAVTAATARLTAVLTVPTP